MSTVIDDVDGRIGYVGTSWSTNHTDDSFTEDYYDGTLSVFDTMFQGIYGVVVDSGDIQYYSGYSKNSSLQQLLYASSGLEEGDHTLKISNENSRNVDEYPTYIWLDIDAVSVNGELKSATTISTSSSSGSETATSSEVSSLSSSVATSAAVSSATISQTASASDQVTSISSSSIYRQETSSKTLSSLKTSSPTSPLSSTSVNMAQSFDPLQSTGTPATQYISTTSGNQPGTTAASDEGSTTHKTTTVAVSATVIAVALIVIITISGLWFWKRRRRRLQAEEEDYLQPAWQ
ncbi:hypothetical protein B9479_004565 [Cryptococcus floricola]|uniref:Uncharacterized protein n=1 Tax=Cryptococcus floricola TaxID=2591691 RepID=A0A5D3AY65_9TREE|nr:hypothetical protein B9479_004565 [Cryptococcus floricola]